MTNYEATNAQHLRAMGLGDVKLGESYNQDVMDPDRCDATLGSSRCARRMNHTGNHARGGVIWAPVEPDERSNREILLRQVVDAIWKAYEGTEADDELSFEDIAGIAVDAMLAFTTGKTS
jgi:hypothetical protein